MYYIYEDPGNRNGYEACAAGLTFSNSIVAIFICLNFFITNSSNNSISKTWVNFLPCIIVFISIALFCLSTFPIWFAVRQNDPISRLYYYPSFISLAITFFTSLYYFEGGLPILIFSLGTFIGFFGAIANALLFGKEYKKAYGKRASGILGTLFGMIITGVFFAIFTHQFWDIVENIRCNEWDYRLLSFPATILGLVVGILFLYKFTKLKGNLKKLLNLSLIIYLLYIPFIIFFIIDLFSNKEALSYYDYIFIIFMIISLALNRIAYPFAPTKELDLPINNNQGSTLDEDDEDEDNESKFNDENNESRFNDEYDDDFEDVTDKLIQIKDLYDRGILTESEYEEKRTDLVKKLK